MHVFQAVNFWLQITLSFWPCTLDPPPHGRPIGCISPHDDLFSEGCEASMLCCLKSGHDTSTMKHCVGVLRGAGAVLLKSSGVPTQPASL